MFVQHDVAIVPVLNLKQEQEEAVGSHAADEVVASLHREDASDTYQGRREKKSPRN